jgi:hypothetical protein
MPDGPLKVGSFLLILLYQLCNARPLLVPGKSVQAVRSCRVAGNKISRTDMFSTLVHCKGLQVQL